MAGIEKHHDVKNNGGNSTKSLKEYDRRSSSYKACVRNDTYLC